MFPVSLDTDKIVILISSGHTLDTIVSFSEGSLNPILNQESWRQHAVKSFMQHVTTKHGDPDPAGISYRKSGIFNMVYTVQCTNTMVRLTPLVIGMEATNGRRKR